MTLDEKLRAIEIAKDRYLAAVNAMTIAVASGEKSPDAWERMAAELDASDQAVNDTFRLVGAL